MPFRGTYEHTLDDRGRVAIPARYREIFRDGAVLAQGLDGCIDVYTVADYEKQVAFLYQEPRHHRRGRRLRRGPTARCWDVELDRQGRILIPLRLRQWAGVGSSVIVYGATECLEIWEPQRWQQEMAAIDQSYEDDLETLP
ncbi:MAG TPA: cell division/cell wall cluster transcriptional repressor MraZ [Dehalococcoidia bacterium]|nr:cell division/cell wall cluster transcriptional repressor MraZ [Dehalococcoidia bacterium]